MNFGACINHPLHLRAGAVLAAIVLGAGGIIVSTTFAAESNGDLAVSTLVMSDYVRNKQANGSFAPESYVWGQGGCSASSSADPSFDKIRAGEVMSITCNSLAKQNYFPAKESNQAKLLIRVYWGSTAGDDPVMTRNRNATLMGYENALAECLHERQARPMFHIGEDLLEELQDGTDLQGGAFGRYFVVVIAYDYQLMRTRKKERPLWITRFSITGRHNAFNEQLPIMTDTASRYFGQATAGLTHHNLHEGHVDLGELKILGVEPDKK